MPRNGFTLVELVAVIVILAVLAAVALPRYMNARTEAHRAAVAASAGAFESAVRLASIACVTRNAANQDNVAIFGAGNVDFNVRCLPSDTGGNNGNVNAGRCLNVWNGILSARSTANTSTAGNPVWLVSAAGNVCTYTYRRDTAATRRFTYNATTGVIAVTNP
jgi:prepilin-type N-terminal cleavage/methylation domain-containing protein